MSSNNLSSLDSFSSQKFPAFLPNIKDSNFENRLLEDIKPDTKVFQLENLNENPGQAIIPKKMSINIEVDDNNLSICKIKDELMNEKKII